MKLAILAAALILPASAPAPDPAPVAQPQAPAEPLPPTRGRQEMPNLLGAGEQNCPSIARQIADANKRPIERRSDARTLDREPMAHAFLAVDRHVGGCRQVTFLRRNVAPETAMPNPAPQKR
jgi:hypothetical protein